MKFTFPGDTEFTFERYGELPYIYVLEAYENGLRINRKNLHYYEAPHALQTSILANINRDPKKNRKPFSFEDFCMYLSLEDRDIPSSEFGSAAMVLIEKRIFPSWALFAYKDLKSAASGLPPDVLAYLSDDIIILAPQISEGSVKGMMIAMQKASGKLRYLESPCHKQVIIKVPKFDGKFYCCENVVIELITG